MAPTLQEFFLRQKEAARRRSRDVFAMLRPEHMAWKPEVQALSVGETLRHMWTSEEGTRQQALDNDFSYHQVRMPKGLGSLIGAVGTLEEELGHLERVHCETVAAVAAQRPEMFDEERVNETLGLRRKVAVILFGINDHEVHHRAVLMVYLRMLGTPAPLPFKWPVK
jgi:uncharacterized damage-inducible protein DinB